MDPFKSPQEIPNYAEPQKILYAEEVMQNPHKSIKGATKIVRRDGQRLRRSYQCEECDYKTTENSNMRKHIRIVSNWHILNARFHISKLNRIILNANLMPKYRNAGKYMG